MSTADDYVTANNGYRCKWCNQWVPTGDIHACTNPVTILTTPAGITFEQAQVIIELLKNINKIMDEKSRRTG